MTATELPSSYAQTLHLRKHVNIVMQACNSNTNKQQPTTIEAFRRAGVRPSTRLQYDSSVIFSWHRVISLHEY